MTRLFARRNLECSSQSKKMPIFWRNQQRNDSSLHRRVLGSDMLYAIPPDLGTTVIKWHFFFFENCHGIFNVNSVPSLCLQCQLGLTWTSWMVNIYEVRPSHPAAIAKQAEQWGQAGFHSIWVFCATAVVLSTRRLLARSIPKHSVARL